MVVSFWKDEAAVEGKTPDGKIAYRHDGKAAVTYFDGHAGMISMADMKRIDEAGTANSGKNNIFWDGNLDDNR